MEEKVYKLCLVGDSGVGKSSILKRYIHNTFSQYTDSTIGAQYFSKSLDYKDTKVKLQLWDTAGQERYRALVSMYYRNCNAVILVADVTNIISLNNIFYWVNELNASTENTDIFLVLNKIDEIHSNQEIFEEIIKRYEKYNITLVSAKTNTNINELFEKIIDKIYDKPYLNYKPTNKITLYQKDQPQGRCC